MTSLSLRAVCGPVMQSAAATISVHSCIEPAAEPFAMTDPIQYHFSCHCQANIYSLSVPGKAGAHRSEDVSMHSHPLPRVLLTTEASASAVAPGMDEISVCDCSFCVKRLIIWTRQPEDRVKLRKGCEEGKGSVGVYRFGAKDLSHHVRCPSFMVISSDHITRGSG